MRITFEPIGFVRTDETDLPWHWSCSDVRGSLIIDSRFHGGFRDLRPGQRIDVLFHFHLSPEFNESYLSQTPPHREGPLGVFSTCSPIRPNPLGLSVLKIIRIMEQEIHVEGLDMYDGTPILDIKPHTEEGEE